MTKGELKRDNSEERQRYIGDSIFMKECVESVKEKRTERTGVGVENGDAVSLRGKLKRHTEHRKGTLSGLCWRLRSVAPFSVTRRPLMPPRPPHTDTPLPTITASDAYSQSP